MSQFVPEEAVMLNKLYLVLRIAISCFDQRLYSPGYFLLRHSKSDSMKRCFGSHAFSLRGGKSFGRGDSSTLTSKRFGNVVISIRVGGDSIQILVDGITARKDRSGPKMKRRMPKTLRNLRRILSTSTLALPACASMAHGSSLNCNR